MTLEEIYLFNISHLEKIYKLSSFSQFLDSQLENKGKVINKNRFNSKTKNLETKWKFN